MMRKIGTTENGLLIEIDVAAWQALQLLALVLGPEGEKPERIPGVGPQTPSAMAGCSEAHNKAKKTRKPKPAAVVVAKPAKTRKFVREPRMGTCAICSKEFVKKVPVQKCCSDACSLEKNRRYALERSKKNYVSKKATKPAPVANVKPAKSMAKCIICGDAFERKSPIQKCCSAECVTEKNRRYQKAYQDNMAAQADPKLAVKPLRVVTGELDTRVSAAVAEAKESADLN